MADEDGTNVAVTQGSGNVFADLDVAEPEEELAKAQLASYIRMAITRRKLSQTHAAELMGLDQPKVSALMNGRLVGFSSDRLLRCLTALGQDVDIVVRGTSKGDARGRLRVVGNAEFIRDMSKGVTLGGLNIKNMINEERR
jgi:predicted XRE-type DNA-binding protein